MLYECNLFITIYKIAFECLQDLYNVIKILITLNL